MPCSKLHLPLLVLWVRSPFVGPRLSRQKSVCKIFKLKLQAPRNLQNSTCKPVLNSTLQKPLQSSAWSFAGVCSTWSSCLVAAVPPVHGVHFEGRIWTSLTKTLFAEILHQIIHTIIPAVKVPANRRQTWVNLSWFCGYVKPCFGLCGQLVAEPCVQFQYHV